MTSPDLLFPMPYLLHTRFGFPLTILQTQAAFCHLLEKMLKAMGALMRGHQHRSATQRRKYNILPAPIEPEVLTCSSSKLGIHFS